MERASGSRVQIRVRDPPTFIGELMTAVTMSTSPTTDDHRVDLHGRRRSLAHVMSPRARNVGLTSKAPRTFCR